MTNSLNISYSSVQAIAEIIQERMDPAMRVDGTYHFETICEDVRNAYGGVIWKVYMTSLTDGDRTVMEALLQTKTYAADEKDKVLQLDKLMIVNLPRDAGMYNVVPMDKDDNPLCPRPMVKTTPFERCTEYKINPGFRYYRIGDKLYFPDGLPRCTVKVQTVVYGLDLDVEPELVPRDYADAVRASVWNAYFPSKTVQADVTANANPNQ